MSTFRFNRNVVYRPPSIAPWWRRAERILRFLVLSLSQTVYNTKGTRAHTHRELIRKWLWEPKGSSLHHKSLLRSPHDLKFWSVGWLDWNSFLDTNIHVYIYPYIDT